MNKILLFSILISNCWSQSIFSYNIPLSDESHAELSFIYTKSPEGCSLNEEFLAMIANAFKSTIFVETGTFMGLTTERAFRYFKQVHSIELGDQLFQYCKNKFADKPSIILYHGDSAKVLPFITKILNKKAVFFFDAHDSGGCTARGPLLTPIMEELEIIKKSNIKNSIIIIDDARDFYETNRPEHAYPSLQEVTKKILEIDANYQFILISDNLIAFPADNNIKISKVAQAATMSRLYDGTNFTDSEILNAEYCIANACSQEKETIKKLGEWFVKNEIKKTGLSLHYALWLGLIQLADKKFEDAHDYFNLAKEAGLKHWRVDYYIKLAKEHTALPLPQ